jgi:hypothetical protein
MLKPQLLQKVKGQRDRQVQAVEQSTSNFTETLQLSANYFYTLVNSSTELPLTGSMVTFLPVRTPPSSASSTFDYCVYLVRASELASAT